MPHFVIECSEELLKTVSADKLLTTVYETAKETRLFAHEGVGGVKVRINAYSDYLTVGVKKDFVHVFGHIMEGRTVEQKKELSKKIVSALNKILPNVEIISMNILEIEKATYSNKSMV